MRLNEIKEVLVLWGLASRQGITEIGKQIAATPELFVLVPEMRPSLLGLEVAKRLAKEGIKHIYVTDNMLGIIFFKQKVKEVLFFYKDLTNKKFWGICGSLYVCLLAHLHSVPIKIMQGEKNINPAHTTSLLDEYMSIHYNNALPAEDEAVPEAIIG
jgi:translation initiation factor 2B subunit (eIF-2B alpha/beta/delta family)